MKLYTFVLDDGNLKSTYTPPTLTLKALLYETDFSDKEVDSIAQLMVGDTFVLDDNSDGYLAVKRLS
jgi:hypothetical protein